VAWIYRKYTTNRPCFVENRRCSRARKDYVATEGTLDRWQRWTRGEGWCGTPPSRTSHPDSSWHGEDTRLGTPRGSVVLVPVPARPTDERAEQLRGQHANVEPDSQTNGEQRQDIAGTSDGRTAGSRWVALSHAPIRHRAPARPAILAIGGSRQGS
jgi:hypothetical protein